MWNFVKYTLFPLMCGIVLGMLLSTLTKNIAALSWLSYGLSFGIPDPFTLDLNLIKLTFGFSVNLNAATIFTISLCMLAAKFIRRKR